MASVLQVIAQTPDMTVADVTFDSGYRATTSVTHASHTVANWVNNVIQSYSPLAGPNRPVTVGLHIERPWPYSTIALIGLCVGSQCLVYQLRYRNDVGPPARLNEFLNDERFCFVGVAVQLASWPLGAGCKRPEGRGVEEDLRSAGLDRLVSGVLGIEIIRPDEAQRSALLERLLPPEHVALACVDAVFSHVLGRILSAT